MKKIYLVSLIFFVLTSQLFSQSAPTCSLDPTFVAGPKKGVWPDSATNFAGGEVSEEYFQNITVKVPKDTNLIQGNPMTHICFTRFELVSPSNATNYNLPPGLTFTVSNSSLNNGTVNGAPSFKFPGNANNCALITGTPTTAGTYTLKLEINAYATSNPSSPCPGSVNVNSGSPVNQTLLDYYVIKVDPYVGIKEISKLDLKLENRPNPFSEKTSVRFNALSVGPVKLVVRNILGETISEMQTDSKPGINELSLDASAWNSGIYFYTLTCQGFSETKRMIVNR